MEEENIENITETDSNLRPDFAGLYFLPDINFDRHCLANKTLFLKSNKFIYFLQTKSTINKLNTDFILGNKLFGSVKLTTNADLGKYNIATTT